MMKKLLNVNKYILLLIVLSVVCSCTKKKEKTSRVSELPYYSDATFTPGWYDDEATVPSDFHTIPSFSLQDQNAVNVTEKDMDGMITVVDFFFTTCPGICPKMTDNMSLVQEAFLDKDDVQIFSHTVTPEFDSVAVLKEYAESRGIEDKRWRLLTGERKVIYGLGRNQYFVEEDLGLEKDIDDFIHTENFILIDKKRRIRGIYNGLNKTSVRQLIADIKTLANS